MVSRVPVILDTDIGSDIDDAVALAYLLRQPRCELVGVTCVTGEVGKRCALADAVCRAAGREDIPIHAGAREVLLHGPGQPHVRQYEALRGKPHRIDWPAGTAVEYMRKAIRARPGEITLLSIGPFTNLALLVATDPEALVLLKEVVSMAGVFYPGPIDSEWNCRVDPVATAMVLKGTARAGVPHRCYGLDVTMKCRMPVEEVIRRFTAPPLDFVREMTRIWARDGKEVTFHDPLAAAAIFEPGLCEYETGTITADSTPGDAGGRTPFVAGPGSHRVAKSVDPAGFFAEYFGVFEGSPSRG
jgi:purine nucleosidase